MFDQQAVNFEPTPIILKGHNHKVFEVVFSMDCTRIASCSFNQCIVWNLQTLNQIHVYQNKSRVYSLSFSPDGEWIALGEGTNIILWNQVDQDKTFCFQGCNDQIIKLLFSSDQLFIVSASIDKYINIWSFQTKQLLRSVECPMEILAIAIHTNPNILAIHSYDSSLVIQNLFKQGPPIINWKSHRLQGFGLAMTSNSSLIVTNGEKDKIKIWNPKTICSRQLRLVRTFKYHQEQQNQNYAWNFAISVNSTTLAASGFRDKILIFDLIHGGLKQELRLPFGYQQYMAYVDISNDLKYIATGGFDKTISIYLAQIG